MMLKWSIDWYWEEVMTDGHCIVAIVYMTVLLTLVTLACGIVTGQ